MERRDFLKNAGLACGMMAMGSIFPTRVFAGSAASSDLFDIPRPIDVKLNIKPLFGKRIPVELHEGPCRPGDPSQWDPDGDHLAAKEEFDAWKKEVAANMPDNVNILKPVYVEYAGRHQIDIKTWSEITRDDAEVDLYVLSHYRIPGIGAHTDKPMVFVGNKCASLDVPAILNARGEEAYGELDYDHLALLIASLRVRKALQKTKLLIVSDGEWDFEFNSVRSNIKTSVLNDKFGVNSQFITIEEMMAEFVKVEKNKKYIKEAQRITKGLVDNATKNSMKQEDVQRSVMYYLTAKVMMGKYGCNAFTATCQEFCVSTQPMLHKVTPCLTHTLLKDEGYVSACEADTNVFFAMAMQMYMANRTPYMGNTLVEDLSKNLLNIHHDVPGRKMHGYNTPDLPYNIVSFTERNWGATLRYDFGRDKGQDVTFARMTPAADKVLVVKGQLEGADGLEEWGCKLKAIVKVSDAEQYFESAQQTGHHFSMIYGDYTEEMEKLAQVLGIDIEVLV